MERTRARLLSSKARHHATLVLGVESDSVDSGTVRELGLSGLSELCRIEPRLRQFDRTLFGTRALQPTEADAAITSFLRLLSPLFLQRAAHKALEHLIRAYKIHLRNVDAVLECALPFHETQTFVRVLQLPLAIEGTKWAWLGGVQRTGEPPQRRALVKACSAPGGACCSPWTPPPCTRCATR